MSTNFFAMKRSGSSGGLKNSGSSSGGLNAMLDDNFQYALGPPESGFSIFLAERTKKVHFIRHAEVRLAVPAYALYLMMRLMGFTR